jgi:hypothetical protein
LAIEFGGAPSERVPEHVSVLKPTKLEGLKLSERAGGRTVTVWDMLFLPVMLAVIVTVVA